MVVVSPNEGLIYLINGITTLLLCSAYNTLKHAPKITKFCLFRGTCAMANHHYFLATLQYSFSSSTAVKTNYQEIFLLKWFDNLTL